MQINKIKTLQDKETFSGTFALIGAQIKQTKGGKDYLAFMLNDKTGKIEGKVWDYDGDIPKNGTIWSVEGQNSPFKQRSGTVVRKFAEVEKDAYDKKHFIPCLTPDEFTYFQDECESLISLIQDDGIREFVKFTLFSKYPEFSTAVGAKGNHHARIGGLLEHSVHVTKLALNMAEGYRGSPIYEQINKDLLIAGGLVHDLGKIGEYTTDNNVIDMSSEGLLTNHYHTTTAYLMEAWVESGRLVGRDVLNFLFHVTMTHHGKDHSNRPPSSISAWLISAADGVDCFVQAGVDSQKEGGTREDGWTNERIWVLGNHFYDETVLND